MARLLMENVFRFRRGNVFRAWSLKSESSTGRDGRITDELALPYIATIVELLERRTVLQLNAHLAGNSRDAELLRYVAGVVAVLA